MAELLFAHAVEWKSIGVIKHRVKISNTPFSERLFVQAVLLLFFFFFIDMNSLKPKMDYRTYIAFFATQ